MTLTALLHLLAWLNTQAGEAVQTTCTTTSSVSGYAGATHAASGYAGAQGAQTCTQSVFYGGNALTALIVAIKLHLAFVLL